MIFFEIDQAVCDAFPVRVSGKVVIRDKDVGVSLGVVRADDPLDVISVASPHGISLNVDDGAEGTFEGTSPSRIKTGLSVLETIGDPVGKDGTGCVYKIRLVIHKIINRREPAFVGGFEEFSPALFDLPGHDRNTLVHRLLNFGRDLGQHLQATRHVKTPDHAGKPLLFELQGKIHRPGELIGLNPYHANDSPFSPPEDLATQPFDRDLLNCLIENMNHRLHFRTQHSPLQRIFCEGIEAGQRVARDNTHHPSDDITFIVIFGRLDQNDMKPLF